MSFLSGKGFLRRTGIFPVFHDPGRDLPESVPWEKVNARSARTIGMGSRATAGRDRQALS